MTGDQGPAGRPDNKEKDLSQRLDAAGWALFLIWIGVAVLIDIGWGWGLIGVAIIILGEAVIRYRWRLNVGGFWIVVGILFLVGGLWDLFQVPLPLGPVILITCGIAMLWGVVSGKHLMQK